MQIKFVTRSGTNTFTGSGYDYYRSDKLNANTWFNNRDGVAKAKLQQNQFGVRVGGPIVIPGLFDGRNKAFFFVNYEELRQPSDATRNRNVAQPRAAAGHLPLHTAGVQTVNLLQLAARTDRSRRSIRPSASCWRHPRRRPRAARSPTSTPTSSASRSTCRSSRSAAIPTFRIDYNLTDKHRFSSSRATTRQFTDFPDTLNNREASFPGFPGRSRPELGAPGAGSTACGRRSRRTSSTRCASATAARRSRSSTR